MKMGTQLNIILVSFISLFCISMGITFFNLSKIEAKTEEAFENRIEQVRTIDDILVNTALQGLYAREVLIEDTEENRTNLLSYAKD